MKQISCYSLSPTIGGNPQAEVIIGVSLHKNDFGKKVCYQNFQRAALASDLKKRR